jgi:polysaccharide pyruvyl transferase WcaK-like protein
VLDQAFGLIEPSHVRKIRSKAEKKPKPPYRPAALNEDQTTAVAAFIENGHRTRNYVTQRDVLSFIETNFQKCLSYQWIASFLKKHANLICRSVVRPQEDVRLEVLHDYLHQCIRLIKELVTLVPTELLFNVDESGFSDWEERKPKCVLIPITETTFINVKQQLRRDQ